MQQAALNTPTLAPVCVPNRSATARKGEQNLDMCSQARQRLAHIGDVGKNTLTLRTHAERRVFASAVTSSSKCLAYEKQCHSAALKDLGQLCWQSRVRWSVGCNKRRLQNMRNALLEDCQRTGASIRDALLTSVRVLAPRDGEVWRTRHALIGTSERAASTLRYNGACGLPLTRVAALRTALRPYIAFAIQIGVLYPAKPVCQRNDDRSHATSKENKCHTR